MLLSHATYYAYSGCPQGRGFDEQGKKGVIIGEISKEYVNLKFHQISKREYIEERVDVSNLSNIWEIKNKILKTIDEEKRNKNFYKIILYGNLNESINVDLEMLESEIKSQFYFFKLKDEIIYDYNLEEISKGYSVKSKFAKKLLKEIESSQGQEKEILRLALKLGISSFSEGEINDY